MGREEEKKEKLSDPRGDSAAHRPIVMELPTKRAAETAAAAAASKKARTTEGVISGNDEIMADGVLEQDEEAWMQTDRSTTEESGSDDDESMPDRVAEQAEEASKKSNRRTTEETSSDDEFMPKRFLVRKNVDIVRELQIFFQSQGCSDRAQLISSEKHARKLFTEVEMDKFRKIYPTKPWHIRPAPDSWTDYQRLSIYLPDHSHSLRSDCSHYHFTYDFDRAYLKFAEELWESVTWSTTESDARPIAEAIWKRQMPDDVQSELLDDCISGAVTHSRAKKSAEELGSLCFDLYRREVDGKDFVQALNEIIAENGLGGYPINKVFIEEAREKHKGRLWSKYFHMKRICNIEKSGALEENELKCIVTDYFKSYLIITSQDCYAEYVKEKIHFAKELGIV